MRHIVFPALTAVAVFSCTSAHAEIDLILMGKSWHSMHTVKPGYTGYDVNQYNWGGGLEYRFPNSGWFVGGLAYKDSFRQLAYAGYAGYQLTAHLTDHLSVFAAVRAGYLNGSGWHGAGALPSVGVTYRRVSLEVFDIPPVKNGYNVLALMGRISF